MAYKTKKSKKRAIGRAVRVSKRAKSQGGARRPKVKARRKSLKGFGLVPLTRLGLAVKRTWIKTPWMRWLTGGVAAGVLVGGLFIQAAHHFDSSIDSSTDGTRHVASIEKPTGEVADKFHELASSDMAARTAQWSHLVETDWGKSENGLPGELKKITASISVDDVVPLVQEHLDCTTYVETVAALVRSHQPSDFAKELVAIRYNAGGTGFFNRNHFPEADWIPNNIKNGNFTDITETVAHAAGISPKKFEKEISRGAWFAKMVIKGRIQRSLASSVDPEWAKPVTAGVPAIPVDSLHQVLSHIPSGTIVNLVRDPHSSVSVLISHQGLLIREGDRVMIRHASRGGKIATESAERYFTRYAQRADNKDWPLVGINLLAINQPK